MPNILISYNRRNEAVVRTLVGDIEQLGHDVWFDQDLGGGQAWWTQILEQIRACDLFVFALSPEALDSTACQREYHYAGELGKPILPILVAEGVRMNLLPPELAKIQFVDYRERDANTVIGLAKAFTTVPSSEPLPDPLPDPPEIPLSYLGGLAQQVETTSTLSVEEQGTLLLTLKRGLRDAETAEDARTLLERLRKRPDLFAAIGDEIDELLAKKEKERRPLPIPVPVQKSQASPTDNKEAKLGPEKWNWRELAARFKEPKRLALVAAGGIVLVVVLVVALQGNGGTPLPVVSVEIAPSELNMQPGETRPLTATLKDADGKELPGQLVEWESSDPSVASVSREGVVTGEREGTTTITANSGDGDGTTTVKVERTPVASVEVEPAQVTMKTGQTRQLTAKPMDASGNTLSGRAVTWTSSNTSVASVSQAGLVTGEGEGTATITANSEGKEGKTTVEVALTLLPVASIAITPSQVSIQAVGREQLTATPKDANGNTLSGRAVTWTSSNTSVATVSETGVVTGLQGGSTTITVRSGSATNSINIAIAPKDFPPVPLRTDDSADQISMESIYDRVLANEPGGRVELCLHVATSSGWWKGIGLDSTQPTLEGKRSDGIQCTKILSGRKTITFWKAKTFGVHTNVGTRQVDLSDRAGYKVVFKWTRD